MTGFHDHPDQRGVMVRMWAIDLVDGDLPAALLLSQILWWHQPSLDGSPRAKYERAGQRWLLRADDGWEDECRLTTKQVRRVRQVLVARGLVEHRRFKLNGAPTSAWRPLFEAIRPDPELPSEGQFRTTPQGALGTTPQGALPSSLPREVEVQEVLLNDSRAVDFFEHFWRLYPRKTAKGAARKAWPAALKAADGDADRIVQGANRYRNDPNREDEYTAHATTWLNGERWDDGPLPQRRKPLPSTGHRPPVIDTDRSGEARTYESKDL